jgi:GNAT superfamily N-acetyltransferase
MNSAPASEATICMIEPTDLVTLGVWAYFLSKYSWGWDHPVRPISEIVKADYVVGAFAGNQPVGFACVNRLASPDHQDNGEMWFAGWVVVPEFRNRGIGSQLYDECLKYWKSPERNGKFLLSTRNKQLVNAFQRKGWRILRDNALNEKGEPTTIFELARSKA